MEWGHGSGGAHTRVTVFGAAGATGRHVIAAAAEAGHEVTVLVRDPTKLGGADPRITVLQGDARDPDAVGAAVQGAEAVISTIGGPGQERAIMRSDLDWTIARCVVLTGGPATGQVHVLTQGKLGGSRIARADVARWLVEQLEDTTYSRCAVSLW